MVGAGLLWGQVLHIRPTQTVFISTCLSLSSTPLVSRFLAGGSRGDKEGLCFMCQDIIKQSSGYYQVLKLGKYSIRWTITHDTLHSVLVYFVRMKPKCRSCMRWSTMLWDVTSWFFLFTTSISKIKNRENLYFSLWPHSRKLSIPQIPVIAAFSRSSLTSDSI